MLELMSILVWIFSSLIAPHKFLVMYIILPLDSHITNLNKFFNGGTDALCNLGNLLLVLSVLGFCVLHQDGGNIIWSLEHGTLMIRLKQWMISKSFKVFADDVVAIIKSLFSGLLGSFLISTSSAYMMDFDV